MEVYLSENIYIKDEKLFYNDKQIKQHNWHLKLRELGWCKLHKQWISKLNKLHNPSKYGQPNNSLFGSLECGDDGDCFYHCIATSLNSLANDYYDSKDIRKSVADSITIDQFNDIITCYRSMKDLNDFDEEWDPYEIHNLDQFKQQVMISGHNYWADHLMIQLISNVYSVNILILKQNEIDDDFDIYPLCLRYNPDHNTIILIYQNSSHFQLMGHFQGTMRIYFSDQTLPCEIKKLFTLNK